MKKLPSLTNSERSSAACPQRWLLRYGLGLRSTVTSPAIHVGSFVHAAIERLNNVGPRLWTRHSARLAIEQAKQQAITDAQAILAASSSMVAGLSDAEQSAIDCAAIACTIMDGYIARWRSDEDWVVHANEKAFEYRLRDPRTGKLAPTLAAGKIDRIIEKNGQFWIVETKTTALPVAEWVERNRRSPQVLTYAAAARHLGFPVVGVIFDLVNSKPSRRGSELAVLKDGSRLAKPSGLPYCTATEFRAAVMSVHGSLENGLATVDWYRETLLSLEHRDESGFWYHREACYFGPGEIDRVREEIFAASKRVAAWRKRIEKEDAKYDDPRSPDAIIGILSATVADFPREASLCWQYNRLCSYAPICSTHHPADLIPYGRSTSAYGHDELHSAEDASALDK
jgi:hypothetical protein